jgi:hypothetical protein
VRAKTKSEAIKKAQKWLLSMTSFNIEVDDETA